MLLFGEIVSTDIGNIIIWGDTYIFPIYLHSEFHYKFLNDIYVQVNTTCLWTRMLDRVLNTSSVVMNVIALYGQRTPIYWVLLECSLAWMHGVDSSLIAYFTATLNQNLEPFFNAIFYFDYANALIFSSIFVKFNHVQAEAIH